MIASTQQQSWLFFLPLAQQVALLKDDLLEAVKGDQATARFVERERGRGESTYYDNLAVYEDVLVREADGWRFAKRFYHYRFLDQNPFGGNAFSIA